MRIILCGAAICLGLLSCVVAQANPPGRINQNGLPRFENFPTGAIFSGRNRIVLDADDEMFRTRLRDAARQKPNFAAHYVLTTWGCGTSCLFVVIVDVRSGKINWSPGTICCWHDDNEAFEPVRFRLDSRLLILSGLRHEKEGDDGDHYYKIEGSRLVHLKDTRPIMKNP